nr:uncharacterized protein LOC118972594 [Manis javanica]
MRGEGLYRPHYPGARQAGRGRECWCGFEPFNRFDSWSGLAPALDVAAGVGGETPTPGKGARRASVSLSAQPEMGRQDPDGGDQEQGTGPNRPDGWRYFHTIPSPARTPYPVKQSRPELPWLSPHLLPTWSLRGVGWWVVGARCARGKAGAQATLVASGPRGLSLPLYSARPAPRAPYAPPGPIHLLLRTRHRTAQSEPPGGRAVRPSGPAGWGRRGDGSSFHLFLNALLKVETAPASGASAAFSPVAPCAPRRPQPHSRRGSETAPARASYIF